MKKGDLLERQMKLEARLSQLRSERVELSKRLEQNAADQNAVSGGLQEAAYWLAELEKDSGEEKGKMETPDNQANGKGVKKTPLRVE